MVTPEQIAKDRQAAGLPPQVPQQSPTNDLIQQRLSEVNSAWAKSTPTTQTQTGGDMHAVHPFGDGGLGGKYFDNLFQQYKGAISGAKTAVKGGVEQASKGGILNSGRGQVEGGLGVAGGAVNAMFAPVGALADTVVPGKGFMADVGKGAVSGGALGTLIAPGAGTIGGGILGAILGGGLHVVNSLKDSLLNHPGIPEDVKNDVNNAITIGMSLLGERATKGGSGEGEGLNTPVSEVPGNMKTNIEATARQVGNAVKNVAGNVKDSTSGLYKAITAKSPEQVDQFLKEQYTKGVKPTVAGKGTQAQVDSYNNRALTAIRRIVQEKPNLKILDQYGEETGKVPETLDQFSQAIAQTKKVVFDKYDALQKAAGANGAKVDLQPVAQELSKVASDPVLQDTNPKVASYAKKMSDTFSQRGNYTTEQAQTAIENYNKSLKAFYRNPSYDSATQAAVDSMIANQLRTHLDSVIENSTEPGYQDLKNEYGALKTIENDVVKRAQVDGRKNAKGLIDFANIGSAAELARGLVTMNPVDFAGSAAIKGASMYYKYLNNPNTAIKRLFRTAESSGGTNEQSHPSTATDTTKVVEKQSLSPSIAEPPPNVKSPKGD